MLKYEHMKPSQSVSTVPDPSSIAKTVSVILEYAVKSRATDIHIEPRADIVQVRYRIDGILHETMTLPKAVLDTVISHIKNLADLNIEASKTPQEGRFVFKLPDRSLILRVSTLPVVDGEKIVMRLLDVNTHPLSLEELGLEGEGLARVGRALHQPHGLVLVTGPAGSGKTMTLYSMLGLLNKPGINISTIEDPVEFSLPGVNQTQTSPKTGITMAAGLRSLLGQDPDVIMVGEMRDGQTAELAVQGALTGHVILTGLHTDSAATAVTRLLDMGVEPFLVASTTKLVVAQRLARRLCTTCRISYVPPADELPNLKHNFQLETALRLFRGETAPLPTKKEAPTIASPQPANTTPVIAGKMRVIEPIHDIEGSKTILDRIASDPNIINRTLAEAEAKRTEASHPKPMPNETQVTPSDPTKLKAGEFLLYKAGSGCDKCSHNGYIGRVGLFEVMEINDIVTKMIVSRPRADMLQEAAVHEGMIPMQLDGLVKCLRGETSVEEVMRVSGKIDR